MKLLLSRLLVICLLVVGGHSGLDDMLQGGEEVKMGCQCAPRHLCNGDGMIIKDGDGLIDPRIPTEFRDMDCSNNSEFAGKNPVACCHEGASSGTTITPDAHNQHVTKPAGSAKCYYISTLLLSGAIVVATVV